MEAHPNGGSQKKKKSKKKSQDRSEIGEESFDGNKSDNEVKYLDFHESFVGEMEAQADGGSQKKKKSKRKSKDRSEIREEGNINGAKSEKEVKLSFAKASEFHEPFIVSFSNGALSAGGCEGLDFRLYKPSVGQPHWRAATAEGARMRHAGQNFKTPDSKFSSLHKYMIGIHDKDRGEMKLHPVHSLVMEVVRDDDKEPSTVSQPEAMSFAEQRSALIEAFGSSRMKRNALSRAKNRLDELTMKASVDSALAQSTLSTSALVATPDGDSAGREATSVVPPHDKITDQVDKVYDVHDIISQESLKLIGMTESGQKLANATPEEIKSWIEDKEFPELVLKLFKYLPSTQVARERKCSLMLTYCYLVTLQQMKSRQLGRKNPFSDFDIPDTVGQEFLSRFTQAGGEPGSRAMSRQGQETLVAHIIVLALILCGYTVNLADLMADLRIGSHRLEKLCQAVGCQLGKKEGGLKVADLHAPVKFPVERRGMKRKKY